MSMLGLAASSQKITTQSDEKEAIIAFQYLNRIRNNPTAYNDSTGVNLSAISPKIHLLWNDTLAKVALSRAEDLAKNNYFGHVNKNGEGINFLIAQSGYHLRDEWTQNKSNNFFESLQAGGQNGIEAINLLIEDKGVKNKGHRKHLLGMDEWNSKLVDIGVAFVRAEGASFNTYTVIIIAMHDMKPKVRVIYK